MIIKVCGIKDQFNHDELSQLNIDMIGINFYKPSSRYIANKTLDIVNSQHRVGVFVATTIKKIISARDKHQLTYAQLHGDEDVIFCQEIQQHIPIIKVFRIDDSFDWASVQKFDFSNYFLFDTKTSKFGGSGKQFNWSSLNNYHGNVPFLISGGIGPGDVDQLRSISHPMMEGVDLNSKFEKEPGIKDVDLIRNFINEIESNQS